MKHPPMSLEDAQTALSGTVQFSGYESDEANRFAQTKRQQGLRARVSSFGGRFKGDTLGSTKVTFWLPEKR